MMPGSPTTAPALTEISELIVVYPTDEGSLVVAAQVSETIRGGTDLFAYFVPGVGNDNTLYSQVTLGSGAGNPEIYRWGMDALVQGKELCAAGVFAGDEQEWTVH